MYFDKIHKVDFYRVNSMSGVFLKHSRLPKRILSFNRSCAKERFCRTLLTPNRGLNNVET